MAVLTFRSKGICLFDRIHLIAPGKLRNANAAAGRGRWPAKVQLLALT